MTLICKSDAKTNYFLSEKDLDNIPYKEKTNPHYAKTKMKLYETDEIKYIFCQKYGTSFNNIESMLSILSLDRTQKRVAREVKKEKVLQQAINGEIPSEEVSKTIRNIVIVKQRKQQLISALKDKGLAYRADSRLCESYITGDCEDDLEIIVKIMHEMSWLFCFTKYKSINKKMERKERQHAWPDYDYISECAKDEAIKQWLNKKYQKEAYNDIPELTMKRIQKKLTK